MQLTGEHKAILNGDRGKLLQEAMLNLIKCAEALGTDTLIPVTSAHTSFLTVDHLARCFSPRCIELSSNDLDSFEKLLLNCKSPVKTTINPGIIDVDKWKEMGSDEDSYIEVKKVITTANHCNILSTFSCIPYITDNIPMFGESCAWSETSAVLYANSFIGARTNRESYETSLYSSLLGLTAKYGMHIDENRYGTDLVEVKCDINNEVDWGVLGYFIGKSIGIGVPVITGLRIPTVEEAKQMAASVNVPGGLSMMHIVGVTPEAPSLEVAFSENKPRRTFVFDEEAKFKIYQELTHNPYGDVDMVFLGCPHNTLYEIKEICDLLNSRHVANNVKCWVMTTSSIRSIAERLGYSKILKESGVELLADGCLNMYYSYGGHDRPSLNRVVTNSVKQAFSVHRAFGSNTVLVDVKDCIKIAVNGGYYDESKYGY